ncbi:DUF308 domain-containing protein [Nocardioides sp.]|uniref:HdeD family acid-resistance protein n=1 Tax=Nocardioides sp. TaxID=35761 RepID=UPI0026316FB0|nr:DUF308 domain-containing protein [Nocardioides sp.]
MIKDWLSLSWKLLMVRGAIGIVFGIVAMVWPISTIWALVVLWGIWALIDGIGSLAHALEPGTSGAGRIFFVLFGIIGLAAAVIAITRPGLTAVTLTWVLGIWLIARGVMEVIGSFGAGQVVPRALLWLSAAIDILLGILFAANPGRSAVSIAFVLGLVALAWGLVFLVVGFLLRSELKAADSRV